MARERLRTLGVAGISSVATAVVLSRWLRGLSPLRSDLVRRVDRGTSAGSVRLTVVVPAYLEEGRIAATVARLTSELAAIAADGGLEVVVVDDGSPDATAKEAEGGGGHRGGAPP